MRNTPQNTFFNFFNNLRTPSLTDIKLIDFEVEKELGQQLDTEFEIAIEFVEEIIPHATEYFVGIKHDSEEYMEYVQEKIMEGEKKPKQKK